MMSASKPKGEPIEAATRWWHRFRRGARIAGVAGGAATSGVAGAAAADRLDLAGSRTTDSASDRTEATDTEATDTEATDTEATDTEATDTEATDTDQIDADQPDTDQRLVSDISDQVQPGVAEPTLSGDTTSPPASAPPTTGAPAAATPAAATPAAAAPAPGAPNTDNPAASASNNDPIPTPAGPDSTQATIPTPERQEGFTQPRRDFESSFGSPAPAEPHPGPASRPATEPATDPAAEPAANAPAVDRPAPTVPIPDVRIDPLAGIRPSMPPATPAPAPGPTPDPDTVTDPDQTTAAADAPRSGTVVENVTDANGNIIASTSITYDDDGNEIRRLERTFDDNGSVLTSTTTTTNWNDGVRSSSTSQTIEGGVRTSDSTERYDAEGDLIEREVTSYDSRGTPETRVEITFEGGAPTSHRTVEFDDDGTAFRVTTVIDDGRIATDHAPGQWTRTTVDEHGNVTTEVVEVDDRANVRSEETIVRDPSGDRVASTSATYDEDGAPIETSSATYGHDGVPLTHTTVRHEDGQRFERTEHFDDDGIHIVYEQVTEFDSKGNVMSQDTTGEPRVSDDGSDGDGAIDTVPLLANFTPHLPIPGPDVTGLVGLSAGFGSTLDGDRLAASGQSSEAETDDADSSDDSDDSVIDLDAAHQASTIHPGHLQDVITPPIPGLPSNPSAEELLKFATANPDEFPKVEIPTVEDEYLKFADTIAGAITEVETPRPDEYLKLINVDTNEFPKVETPTLDDPGLGLDSPLHEIARPDIDLDRLAEIGDLGAPNGPIEDPDLPG